MSRKNGIKMIDTIIAARDDMYSLTVSWVMKLYWRSNFYSIFCQYSMMITGVIKTTERIRRKTHRMTVFVVLITESFVKSSQMMSDWGNA